MSNKNCTQFNTFYYHKLIGLIRPSTTTLVANQQSGVFTFMIGAGDLLKDCQKKDGGDITKKKMSSKSLEK